MSVPKTRPYQHYGVLLPYADSGFPSWTSDNRIEKDGFILLKRLQYNVFALQSVNTGELVVNKLLGRYQYSQYDTPEDLRVSTAPDAVKPLPEPIEINGVERVHFQEMKLWQKLPGENYSLYTR